MAMKALEQDQIVQEIFIDATPERVFKAITTPEELLAWWGDDNAYRCDKWNVDLRVGGRWHSEGKGTQGMEFTVDGTYLEIDPPNVLVYTWEPSWHKIPPTTVRWELNSQGTGTLVRITHSGFAGNVDAKKDHESGWPHVLAWLNRYVSKK
jgi:uncharacterized protein YndB with AHSA1/START domain